LQKPVVNSNQAVLWGCLTRLKRVFGDKWSIPGLGRLLEHRHA
jgi:maleate cis-trans isomerase